jgi:hypothetical protein
MNKPSLAAVIPALTLGLALPAIACAHGQGNQGTAATDPVAQAQTEQQRLPAAKDDAVSDTPAAPRQDKSEKAKKHPPTDAMDRATPADKSTNEKAGAPKHPPTSAMDRAVPEEKSPQ